MKKSYNPNLPIETIFERNDEAVEFALAGNNPYSTLQIVTTAYYLIINTGIFPDDCRGWKHKPAIDKTWVSFQAHFTEAHLEMRESEATTLFRLSGSS